MNFDKEKTSLNIDFFLKTLGVAAAKVESRYFRVYERLYTYELYHQLRLVLPESAHLLGEHVKSTPSFKEVGLINPLPGPKVIIPDFVYYNRSNKAFCAIEIKVGLSGRALVKDLEKLSRMIRLQDNGTQFAEYGVFHSIKADREQLVRLLNKPLYKKDVSMLNGQIYLGCQKNPTETPQYEKLENLITK